MIWPTVIELPRNLEPSTPDPFVQDLDERDEIAAAERPVGTPPALAA